jgi:hypothetical protein
LSQLKTEIDSDSAIATAEFENGILTLTGATSGESFSIYFSVKDTSGNPGITQPQENILQSASKLDITISCNNTTENQIETQIYLATTDGRVISEPATLKVNSSNFTIYPTAATINSEGVQSYQFLGEFSGGYTWFLNDPNCKFVAKNGNDLTGENSQNPTGETVYVKCQNETESPLTSIPIYLQSNDKTREATAEISVNPYKYSIFPADQTAKSGQRVSFILQNGAATSGTDFFWTIDDATNCKFFNAATGGTELTTIQSTAVGEIFVECEAEPCTGETCTDETKTISLKNQNSDSVATASLNISPEKFVIFPDVRATNSGADATFLRRGDATGTALWQLEDEANCTLTTAEADVRATASEFLQTTGNDNFDSKDSNPSDGKISKNEISSCADGTDTICKKIYDGFDENFDLNGDEVLEKSELESIKNGGGKTATVNCENPFESESLTTKIYLVLENGTRVAEAELSVNNANFSIFPPEAQMNSGGIKTFKKQGNLSKNAFWAINHKDCYFVNQSGSYEDEQNPDLEEVRVKCSNDTEAAFTADIYLKVENETLQASAKLTVHPEESDEDVLMKSSNANYFPVRVSETTSTDTAIFSNSSNISVGKDEKDDRNFAKNNLLIFENLSDDVDDEFTVVLKNTDLGEIESVDDSDGCAIDANLKTQTCTEIKSFQFQSKSTEGLANLEITNLKIAALESLTGTDFQIAQTLFTNFAAIAGSDEIISKKEIDDAATTFTILSGFSAAPEFAIFDDDNDENLSKDEIERIRDFQTTPIAATRNVSIHILPAAVKDILLLTEIENEFAPAAEPIKIDLEENLQLKAKNLLFGDTFESDTEQKVDWEFRFAGDTDWIDSNSKADISAGLFSPKEKGVFSIRAKITQTIATAGTEDLEYELETLLSEKIATVIVDESLPEIISVRTTGNAAAAKGSHQDLFVEVKNVSGADQLDRMEVSLVGGEFLKVSDLESAINLQTFSVLQTGATPSFEVAEGSKSALLSISLLIPDLIDLPEGKNTIFVKIFNNKGDVAKAVYPINIGIPATGDLNNDGRLSLVDAVTAMKIFSGSILPNGVQMMSLDLNGNTRVDLLDVVGVFRRVMESQSGSNPFVACTRATSHLLILTDLKKSTAPGAPAEFEFTIENNDSSSCGVSEFILSTSLDPAKFTVNFAADKLRIAPNSPTKTSVKITPKEISGSSGEFDFQITATAGTVLATNTADISVSGDCGRENPTVTLTPITP